MEQIDETWALIEAYAAELGVNAEARKKWRQRGVPHRWRLPLVNLASERGQQLDAAAFDRPPAVSRIAA